LEKRKVSFMKGVSKMKKIIIGGLAAVVGLTAWVGGVSATGSTLSTETEIEVIVDDTLSIASDGKVSISVMPGASVAVLETGVDHVRVSTNASGYKLYIKDKDADTNLNSAAATTPIAAGSGNFGTPAALGDEEWGYRLSTFAVANTFAGVTAVDVPIKTTATTATNDITEITYGVNLTTGTNNGVYTDVVVYTAVNN
jgi:hypothetical protein